MKLITIPNKNLKKFNDFFLCSSRKQFKCNFFGKHPIFFQTKLTTRTCTHKYISYIAFKINFQITLYMALIRPPNCYTYMKPHTHTHKPISLITLLTMFQITQKLKPKKQSHMYITSLKYSTHFQSPFFFPFNFQASKIF